MVENIVTSNFSFSHNVFHSYISFVRQTVALYGTGLKAHTKMPYRAEIKLLKTAQINFN